MIYSDAEASAAQAQLSSGLHTFGHYQLSSAVNGTFDNLNVERSLSLGFIDPTGATINGFDFSQPIDWVSGINGFGTGSFSLRSEIYEDGNESPYSGALNSVLMFGGGTFALSSLRSTQVPEPESLALLAIRLAALFLPRTRKKLAGARSATPPQ